MQKLNAVVLFAKAPRIARSSPQEPYESLPWEDLDALFTAMLGDVVETATQMKDTDVLLYRNPAEMSDDFVAPLRQRVRCCDLREGPLSENVQLAVESAFAEDYHRVVVLLENDPMLRPRFLYAVTQQLGYEDDCMVVGPTIDGRCYLVGMKANHSSLFGGTEFDPIGRPYALLERICAIDAMLFTTSTRYMLDSGSNLARLRREIDDLTDAKRGFPRRTHEIFKLFDRKYRAGRKAAR